MSEKLKQLIANNTLSVRQAKTIEELAEIEETLFKGIESLFSLQGVSHRRELLIAYEKEIYSKDEWIVFSDDRIKIIDKYLSNL